VKLLEISVYLSCRSLMVIPHQDKCIVGCRGCCSFEIDQQNQPNEPTMKKHLLFLLLLGSLMICPGAGVALHQQGTTNLEALTSVYICTGKSSERYHRTESCNGLNACKAQVKSVSLKEAQRMGRTPCKICY
jgi:hypothetical protein